jgi:hypothetical protein
MIRELEDRGYEILSVQRGPSTLSGELLTAAVIAVQSVSRSPHLPWLPPATLAERITRAAALAVGIPFIAAGLTADLIKDADPSPDSIGNAYRIVARSPQK